MSNHYHFTWNARNFVLTLLLVFFGFCGAAPTMMLLCFSSWEETERELALQESVSISSSSGTPCWETEERPRHRCWAAFSEAGYLLLGVDFWPFTQSLPLQPSNTKLYINYRTAFFFVHWHRLMIQLTNRWNTACCFYIHNSLQIEFTSCLAWALRAFIN